MGPECQSGDHPEGPTCKATPHGSRQSAKRQMSQVVRARPEEPDWRHVASKECKQRKGNTAALCQARPWRNRSGLGHQISGRLEAIRKTAGEAVAAADAVLDFEVLEEAGFVKFAIMPEDGNSQLRLRMNAGRSRVDFYLMAP